jgi:cyclohexa-1,5-dienecarbonyl-CoA hydratase
MMYQLGEALETARSARIVQFEADESCRAFSAGVDVADHVPERVDEMLTAFHAIFRQLFHARFLTLAIIRGACLGGGAELAAFCDHVIASPRATFGFPETRLGCFPPVASITLPGLIGQRRALEMVLSGDPITAEQAKATGLINELVPENGLTEAAENVCRRWLALSGEVLPIARRALLWPDFEQRLETTERLYRQELLGTHDAREGIDAFLEKRAPRWSSAGLHHREAPVDASGSTEASVKVRG